MTTALADRTSRSAGSRFGGGLETVRAKRTRRPTLSTPQVSAMDPAKAAVVADVMAALAAFGLRD